MSDPTTSNMGLTVPQGGSTPGAANNVTSGTFPYEIAGDLALIDTHDHSSGKGVQIGTAGINIDANFSFNGYSVTAGAGSFTTLTISSTFSASSLSIAGSSTIHALSATTGTFSSTLGVTGASTLAALSATTGTFSSTLGVTGATTLSSLTVSGNATLEGNLTLSGTFETNLVEALATDAITIKGQVGASAGPGVIIDNVTAAAGTEVLSIRSGGTELANFDYIGNLNLVGGGIVQTASSTGILLTSNVGGTGNQVVISNPTGLTIGGYAFIINSGTLSLQAVDYLGNLLFYQGGGPVQKKSSTALTLLGNGDASGGLGVITDNATAQTSGKALSIRSGGTELVNVDFAGTVVGPLLTLNANGHIIPTNGTPPTVGNFASAFGTVTYTAVTGNDVAMQVVFAAGTYSGTPIPFDTALFEVTLNQAYSSNNFVILVDPVDSADGAAITFSAGAISGSQFAVYCNTSPSFTPVTSVVYTFRFVTFAAGATY